MPISYAHRLFIWKYSAEKSMEKPLLGYGLGSSKLIKPLESEVVYYNDIRLSTMPMHPHNNVMQIFLELGLVGLILFASYIWNILSRITELSVKDFELSLTSYAIFINYFVIGMISFNMWQSWWMMIILFMLLLMNMVRHAK
ncbi:MAG UNVERIFIED_CONTAM: O-antigen ligase family protein [Rickettsiaceae bacterium]